MLIQLHGQVFKKRKEKLAIFKFMSTKIAEKIISYKTFLNLSNKISKNIVNFRETNIYIDKKINLYLFLEKIRKIFKICFSKIK